MSSLLPAPLRSQVALVIAAYVCMHAAMAGARLAAPLLLLHQGHAKAAIGLLMTQFALSQVVLSLPAGRFADRHGLKRPYTLAALASGGGLLAAVLWPGYASLWAAALLAGAGMGVGSIAMQRHIGHASESPTELRQMFAWVSTAPAVGSFGGPLLAGMAIDHLGFQGAFILLGLLPLASWLLSRRVHEHPGRPAAAAGRRRAMDLLRIPMLRRLLSMNALMSVCWEIHGFMLPLLGHERAMSASSIGTLMGVFGLAAVCVRLAMPAIAARWREWVLMTSAIILAGAVLVAYPFTTSVLQMGLCSAILGFALGSVQPLVLMQLHLVAPKERQGEALALRLMTVNLAGVVMPFALGAIGGWIGVQGVFWLGGVLVTLFGGVGGRRLRDAPDNRQGD